MVEGKFIAMLNGHGNPFESIRKDEMTALLFRPSSELYIHYTERLELGK
jgi:hypothetical protein